MSTGLLYDSQYLDHNAGSFHPECPERVSHTFDYLQKLPIFNKLRYFKPKQVELDWILKIHSVDYVRRANDSCRNKLPFLDTQDVGICPLSFEIAKLSVGGALRLADEVMLKNIKNGFALIRPPGHHAEYDIAMGFCIFNNVAILARYLQNKHGVEKVLIIDFDVHHGNGTQSAFYEDPSVFYISLHQYPFYPGTGAYDETGEGKAKGTTLNCPMPKGASDKDYKEAFIKKIIPKSKEFKPDVILISAGFDAHKEDPLANICLTTDCFGWMTRQIKEIADEYSGGRIISLLEGGYNLKVLPECIEAHLLGLVDDNDVAKNKEERV